ncbi:hypothetical protein BLS_000108 [Venturia inaequalis]|uniref:Uncharacterized protein n=1 Tax=Venturia inaequalis TaxID=5025 RepID=A0A8H3YLG8_VENIN|nr:hypothetical protein BLS_000108 [Venturia inaequalis]KAE9992546.1 hypothetical protein EG327_008683 [Venturia inaequalis]
MYTVEQIIQALEAFNARNVTNTTESYSSNLANTSSEYASNLTNLTSEDASHMNKGASSLLVYAPAATALTCVVIAVLIYLCGPNKEANERARKILERKQTGFFRPQRDESYVDRKPTRKLTRKLTKEESLKIMEVIANATDEVTTMDRAIENQADDRDLPEDIAEAVLKEHSGQDQGIDFSSSSDSDLGVDDGAETIKPVKSDEEEDGDNESTPTASGYSARGGNSKNEDAERETERPVKPEHLITTGGEEEQPEESDDERLDYLDEYSDQSPTDDAIMSDDEGYTRPVGQGLAGGESESPASHATADTPKKPRRSSWHGEDQSLDAEFEKELKAKRKPTLDLDFPEEEKRLVEAIPSPPSRRTTNQKKSERPPMKKANSRVPTFGAEGIVPSRRASTKKTEVSATAAMAEYAEEGQMGEGVRRRV